LFNVRGKIALVTGGGTGIGKTIASALVQNGAKVYIAARKEAQLKEAAAELNALGPGSAHYIVANLSNKAGVDALISALAALEPAKTLHILVNNSGVSWGSPFEAVPEDKGWDNVMAVNVKSLFYLTAGLSSWLAKEATAADPAHVVNVSSTASVTPHAEGIVSADGNGTYSCQSCIPCNSTLPFIYPFSRQHQQGSSKPSHIDIGGQVRSSEDYGECNLPRILSNQDDSIWFQVRGRRKDCISTTNWTVWPPFGSRGNCPVPVLSRQCTCHWCTHFA
jgi:NAD(P)-dependent dehydrogenase (short-subunit alcohol dehydrogenase family)